MYSKAKKDISDYIEKYMIKSGEKERIETNIFGPKQVRDTLPQAQAKSIAKHRNEFSTTDASASLADLCVVPDDFSSIQLRADQV